jgi:type I restriction enzyme, S subunit
MNKNNEDKLPEGWIQTALRNVAEINPGVDTSKLSDSTLVSFVPMAAVEAGTGRIDLSEQRTLDSVRRSYVAFRDGDVLFAKITPCMENGKFAIARSLSSGIGFGSTEFHVLRPENGVDAQFLYYYISQESFRQNARSQMTGSAGQLRVPAAFLASISFPLAPTNEQHRIVSAIEQQFTRLDAGIAALRHAKAKLKRYRGALLAAAIDGRLTEAWRTNYPDVENAAVLLNHILEERRVRWEAEQLAKMQIRGITPKDDEWKKAYKEPQAPYTEDLPLLPEGWCWATIEQCASRVTDGTHQPPHFTDKGIPFIFISNIVSGTISFENTKYISEATYQQLNARCPVEYGDILYSAVGSYGVAVPVLTDRPFSFQRHIAHIKPSKLLSMRYLVLSLNSPLV